MIAALGMYDRAETAPALDRLWSLIRDGLRAEGIAAPEGLTRGGAAYASSWQSPDLLLGQTCGLPFRAGLHRHVALVGTPDHGVEGCPPGYYRSVLVARADDPRDSAAAFGGARLAINDAGSQSGWAAPQAHFAALGARPAAVVVTGAHRASAQAVLNGEADLAAIDAVTWALIAAHDGWSAGLKVVGQTEATPGLPLITARAELAPALFAATAAAIDALAESDRRSLRLRGLVRIPAEAYLALPLPPPAVPQEGAA